MPRAAVFITGADKGLGLEAFIQHPHGSMPGPTDPLNTESQLVDAKAAFAAKNDEKFDFFSSVGTEKI